MAKLTKEKKQQLSLLIGGIILGCVVLGVTIIQKMTAEKEVILANEFLAEGTTLKTEADVLKAIKKGVYSLDSYNKTTRKVQIGERKFKNEPDILLYNDENKKYLIGKTIKYNREENDPIRLSNTEINLAQDEMKYKLFGLSEFYGVELVGKTVKLNKDEYLLTQGVGKGTDYVRVFFIRDIGTGQTKVTKMYERYRDFPVIDFKKDGTKITDIVLAMPPVLALKFELERQSSKKLFMTFSPFKFESLKVGKITSFTRRDLLSLIQSQKTSFSTEELEAEYASGIIYSWLDMFEGKLIENFHKSKSSFIEKANTKVNNIENDIVISGKVLNVNDQVNTTKIAITATSLNVTPSSVKK